MEKVFSCVSINKTCVAVLMYNASCYADDDASAIAYEGETNGLRHHTVSHAAKILSPYI